MTNQTFDEMEITGVYVGELLTHSTFVIPSYQRSYSWGAKEITDLCNDIVEHNSKMKSSPGDYPFGEIKLEKGSKQNDFNVADGQQRLISSYILVSAAKFLVNKYKVENLELNSYLLISELGDTGVKLISRLTCDNDEDNISLNKVLQTPEPTLLGSNKFDLAYKIAIDFFENYISEKGLNEFKSLIINFLKYFKVTKTVTSTGTGLQAFSKANNRGKKLDEADLTKAQIISFCNHKNDPILVSQLWAKALKDFSDINISPSKSIQLWANAELSDSSTVLRGLEVRETISEEAKTRVDKGEGKVIELIEEFCKYASAYKQVYYGNNYDGSTSVALTNIRSNPALKSQTQLLSIMPAARSLKVEDFETLAISLEKTIMVASLSKAYPPDVEKVVAIIINELRKIKNLKSESGANALNELKKFRDSLKHDFANRVVFGLEPNLPTKAGTLICKYAEASLENLITGKMLHANTAYDTSLEHILPQKLTEIAISEYKSEMHAKLDRFRIGNLTLLESSLNSKGSNDKVSSKITEIYAKSKFYTTKTLATLPSNINKSAGNFDDYLTPSGNWSHEQLENRSLGILKLICNYLDVEYVKPSETITYEEIQEFPQADIIDRFESISRAILDNQVTREDIQSITKIHDRQVSYYLAAMRICELLEETDLGWKLTDAGEKIFKNDNWEKNLSVHLSNLPLIVAFKSLSDESEKKEFFGKHLAEVTYKRRVKTLNTWLSWIDKQNTLFS